MENQVYIVYFELTFNIFINLFILVDNLEGPNTIYFEADCYVKH